ncbi:MAG: glycosyltransferase [Clostridia bacterium]|nr:glycosyltransferase [Clostridia bacterium]
MSRFEILCVTMHQNDFSKIEQMNIHSDVVFANQADTTRFDEKEFNGHYARMITTDTRGVGINRNLALIYAKGEICLFSDDDITYNDDVEKKVLAEFDTHPDADIIIFHLNSDDPTRTPKKYSKTKKHSRLKGLRWGATRVAFRLSAAKKANLWFTTLFGGGCVFAAGEDSLWLNEARKKGLKFYVSKETIGNVSFESSTWFTGYDEKLFYGKGAFCAQKSPRFANIWPIYYVWRFINKKELSSKEKYVWMKHGIKGYREMLSFNAYKEKYKL